MVAEAAVTDILAIECRIFKKRTFVRITVHQVVTDEIINF